MIEDWRSFLKTSVNSFLNAKFRQNDWKPKKKMLNRTVQNRIEKKMNLHLFEKISWNQFVLCNCC